MYQFVSSDSIPLFVLLRRTTMILLASFVTTRCHRFITGLSNHILCYLVDDVVLSYTWALVWCRNAIVSCHTKRLFEMHEFHRIIQNFTEIYFYRKNAGNKKNLAFQRSVIVVLRMPVGIWPLGLSNHDICVSHYHCICGLSSSTPLTLRHSLPWL